MVGLINHKRNVVLNEPGMKPKSVSVGCADCLPVRGGAWRMVCVLRKRQVVVGCVVPAMLGAECADSVTRAVRAVLT